MKDSFVARGHFFLATTKSKGTCRMALNNLPKCGERAFKGSSSRKELCACVCVCVRLCVFWVFFAREEIAELRLIVQI